MAEKPRDYRIAQLLQHRKAKERDQSLSFLPDLFKREVRKPHQQLAALVGLWEQLVPTELAAHTRLESLQRGVLRVSVDTSSRLYELDRLLRSGLERELVTRHAGPAFRRVRLQVDPGFTRDEA